MKKQRTFGWVQNPGDLKKLKRVVSVFLHNSKDNEWLLYDRLPLLLKYDLISDTDCEMFTEKMGSSLIEVDYSSLKGKGAGRLGRANALCTGIIQATLDGQKNKTYTSKEGETINIKKPYSDDWSAEGYLRWAISCGLLIYDNKKDTCKLSDLGKLLASSEDDSKEEFEALSVALLSYPPVTRILSLLMEKDNQTKFELGSKLGFKGELGFTSIPEEVYLCDYSEAVTSKEKSNVRSNDEGDSDKYARGIASWCTQMGWVESSSKEVTGEYRGKSYTASLQTYSITRAGEKALIKSHGNSSNPKIPKIVMFEMLASNRAHGADYLRYQRAAILNTILSSAKNTEQIKNSLKGYELDIDDATIKDHIEGLRSIGVDIEERNGKYKLNEKITSLIMPPRAACIKDNVNDIVDRVRNKLTSLDHKYLVLIDLAFSDASSKQKKNADAREFEIETADLFTHELGFKGMRLGDANRPDVIISHGDNGTIIDNKSYKDGFNISKGTADEMGRYINENIIRSETLNSNKWWGNFDSEVTNFTFLFVTSYLKGEFKKQLEYISKAHNDTKGAGVSVENLLYFAEGLKSGKYSYQDFYDGFKNEEMEF